MRQALGATSARILRSVIARGLALVGTGLALGFVLTIVATRALAGLLFGIGPLDPIALAGTAGVLIVVAVVASAWPAMRAAAVAPAVAMRGIEAGQFTAAPEVCTPYGSSSRRAC